jgi:hypothetical protein
MDAAVKKRAFQRLAEARGGGIGRLWILSHFQVGITAEQMKTANMLHVSASFSESSTNGVAATGGTD